MATGRSVLCTVSCPIAGAAVDAGAVVVVDAVAVAVVV